jgi:hypothetical protein
VFIVSEQSGVRFLEAPPDAAVLGSVNDLGSIIEACFSARSLRVLLYAPNLTANFFDLSSGEAGAILQKLRQYRIRAAVVCAPGEVRFSTRFPELMAEEKSIGMFGIFESAEAAREWLVARNG